MEMALLMMVQTHYWMKNWRGDLSGGRLSRGRRKDHDISNRVNSYTVQKNIIEKKRVWLVGALEVWAIRRRWRSEGEKEEEQNEVVVEFE